MLPIHCVSSGIAVVLQIQQHRHRTKEFSLIHSQNLAKYIQNCTEQDDYEVDNINCCGLWQAANL
jgi:hypothetical protein